MEKLLDRYPSTKDPDVVFDHILKGGKAGYITADQLHRCISIEDGKLVEDTGKRPVNAVRGLHFILYPLEETS